MKNTILSIAVILILLAGLFYWMSVRPETSDAVPENQDEIASFEACVAAGNPVMESYPARCSTPDGRSFTEDIGNELELTDRIRSVSPRPNATVSSPLTVSGEARGMWYFEASFPIRLEDASGNVLVEHYAEAQGEWMTEEFVPFAATLEFETPATETGMLILEKDNPSGLPENADALRIPVRFSD